MFLLRDDIEEIKGILEKGGTLLYPTDTIWGIGCDAMNEAAIQKIDAIKKRPAGKGYILLVSDLQMLQGFTPKIHPRLETLLHFHTRPLTIVYKKVKNLPDFLRSDDGSVGIRLVKDPFCVALINALGRPIVSTSANLNGEPFPATFGGVSSSIIQAVDYVVKHRQDDKVPGEPSIIAKLDSKADLDFIRE